MVCWIVDVLFICSIVSSIQYLYGIRTHYLTQFPSNGNKIGRFSNHIYSIYRIFHHRTDWCSSVQLHLLRINIPNGIRKHGKCFYWLSIDENASSHYINENFWVCSISVIDCSEIWAVWGLVCWVTVDWVLIGIFSLRCVGRLCCFLRMRAL